MNDNKKLLKERAIEILIHKVIIIVSTLFSFTLGCVLLKNPINYFFNFNYLFYSSPKI